VNVTLDRQITFERKLRPAGRGNAGKETWQPVDLVTLKPQPRTSDIGPAFRLSWTVRF